MVPGNVALLETAQGAWVTQALYAAAKLGIADELAQGPKTAVEVAARVGGDPDSVFRLMRMLAGRSVFSHRADGRFELTAMGQALRADVPGSLRPMVLFIGSPEHWAEWGELLHSVQTGQPAPKSSTASRISTISMARPNRPRCSTTRCRPWHRWPTIW